MTSSRGAPPLQICIPNHYHSEDYPRDRLEVDVGRCPAAGAGGLTLFLYLLTDSLYIY